MCRPLSESYRSAGKVMDSSDFGDEMEWPLTSRPTHSLDQPWSLPKRRPPAPSPKHVGPGQIDDFVAAPVEHRLDHEEAEPDHLVHLDRRRKSQFLAIHRHFK